jgi:Prophage minor tail protein Z (GPZ)
MKISISADFPSIYKELRTLPAQVRDGAMASALNKTIEQGRTAAIREITSEYNVKAKYVRERLIMRRARRSDGAYSVTASLAGGDGRKRAANIITFGARQTSKGVSVSIRKGGGRKLIANAFIGNKGRTVFMRVPGTTMASRAKYSGTKHAEQIKAVQTIDVPQMFTQRRINEAIETVLRERFAQIFQREAKYFSDRFNSKR